MDYSAALRAENRLFGDLVRAAAERGVAATTPVPSCPGWTVRKLAAHVARGDRWAATIVGERSSGPVDPRTVADGTQPDDPAEEQKWVHGGAAALLDAVTAVGPETPVWTFVGPKPASWWIRRRLHEATVHRADGALALGVPFDIPPELAADGVSEWLDLVAARADSAPLEEGTTLHLHASDGGEWLISPTGTGVTWTPGHAKATTAVRGPAVDLLLNVLRRSSTGVEVLGEPAVWKRWLDSTGF